MELVHAPLNLRGRDNHSPRPSGNPMPAKKFMRRSVRTSQGISAIMAARRGASLRVRIEQGTNSGKRPAQYQLATNRCGVRRRWLRGFRIYAVEWKKWRRSVCVTRLSHSNFSRSTSFVL